MSARHITLENIMGTSIEDDGGTDYVRLKFAGVTGHQRIRCNQQTDELTKRAASTLLIWSEPFIRVERNVLKVIFRVREDNGRQ